VKRPSRKARPYALPRLLDGSTALSANYLETYCRSIVRAAWAAGERGATKAAREYLARCHLTPANIAAIARTLYDYNRRPWPMSNTTEKLDWLYKGAGCCERHGTAYDAHLATWSALSAALSIIVDVPLECLDDEDALLELLFHTDWRHVPYHQQARVAQRMARHVSHRIRPYVPTARA
jgi:hypothetical protein